ncbi:hypothetical protein [Shewanella insulae]|uniref:hypothetical protein n=1 Tax=Shewanella insulae TaxID=2681496 RepID=UPI00247FFB42|nr:hypothetical protein [Shewanella insulae]
MKSIFPLFLALFTGLTHASDWPEIDFPDTAKVEIVADEMRYNGYPMKTWVVKDTQTQAQLAAFFTKAWQKDSERFDSRPFNGDLVINSLQPPYLLTARISQQFDGVTAFVGITKNMEENELAKVRRNTFPQPTGATVLSDIASTDLYKQGRTIVLSSPRSLASNYHYYRRHYQQRGWVEETAILDTQSGKAALQMRQGTNSVDISFDTRNSQVYIVANQVKQG